MEIIRIDKYLSVACGVSRTDAKLMLRRGLVSVNGTAVKKSDLKIKDTDSVSVSGQAVVYKKYVYLIMNKPTGVLSASTDKRAKTVIDLVPQKYRHYDLSPVGRLDKDTTGMLLITNDGDFAHRIISPKSNIDKLYRVSLDGKIKTTDIETFARGVILADGTECLPAVLSPLGDGTRALITIREGKYHQVKRMFGTVGLGVNALTRLSIGKLSLPEDLAEGGCRELTDEELSLLWK